MMKLTCVGPDGLMRDGLKKPSGPALANARLMYVIKFYLGPKFSTLLGHMIKCLLTNLGRAEWENIWLSVRTY